MKALTEAIELFMQLVFKGLVPFGGQTLRFAIHLIIGPALSDG